MLLEKGNFATLPQHIKDLIQERNTLRSKNSLNPNIISLNNEITRIIGEHRTNQWKSKLDQKGLDLGHNKNKFYTTWRTIS